MIIQTKTGVQITGEIRSDPEVRSAGQKEVLKFDLRASSTKGPDGKWQSFFVGVNAWHGIAERDGMYQKGDVVTVTARELKSREYNGKTYYNVDADSIVPDDLVQLRWMQQMIDMMAQPAPPPELTPADEPTPFDQPSEPEQVPTQTRLPGGQMYPGENLADYAPRSTSAQEAVPSAEYDPINDDADDLPF
jgi:single-stranded DNA-binding protein